MLPVGFVIRSSNRLAVITCWFVLANLCALAKSQDTAFGSESTATASFAVGECESTP